MTQQPSRDVHMRIAYGDLEIVMIAENISYAADAVHDLRNRTLEAFQHALNMIEPFERALELVATSDEETEDEDTDE